MARQPLPAKYHKGPWAIGPKLIDQRPEVIAWIGKCVTQWSLVEHHQAILLGCLMEANTEVAVAVFATLRTAPVRRDALLAAAGAKLSETDLDLLTAILNYQKKVEGHRNDLTHGHWGFYCDYRWGYLD